MLKMLSGFELKYHFRQASFVAAAVLFPALGFLLTSGNFGGVEVHRNAPYVITYLVAFLSLLSLFASTLFCANVVLRDTTHKMDAVVFATPVRRLAYFAARLLGLVMAVFLLLCLAASGNCLGALFAGSDEAGVFHIAYYLQPLLVFGLPNIVFGCSVVFCTALLTRSTRAVYVAGVFLFILYFAGSILGNSPLMASSALKTNESAYPHLLDPFGLSAFFEQTRSWSAQQRNTRLFPLEGMFLANRLLWMVLSVALLTVAYRCFRLRLITVSGKQKAGTKKGSKAVQLVAYRSVAIRVDDRSYPLLIFRSQLKLETGSVFRHIPFLVMLVLWTFLYAVELKENLTGPYGIRYQATTGFIVEQFTTVRFALLLLVFYSAELIHRERSANIQGLVFSTPGPNIVLWGAKCATLAILIVVLVTINIGIGMFFQIWAGTAPIDPGTYLSLYYYSGLPLLLFAVLIIFIHTIVGNKYLGMLLSLLVTGIFVFGSTLGIRSYLLRYAIYPNLNYSAMNGFGHYVQAVGWYSLYWSSCALVLALLAAGIWQGGTHMSWRQRLRSAGKQWGKTGKVILVASLLFWAFTGIRIHQQSPAANRITPEWQAAYERKYRPHIDEAQPVITAVRTVVDIYPAEKKYTVKGTYRLRNESGVPIPELWLGVVPEVSSIAFSVPGATPVMTDPEFRQHWYKMAQPLAPGAEMSISFSLEVRRSGFTPFNSENSVVSNGSYIELEKYIPFLGYSERYEIGDAMLRKEMGLPVANPATSADSSYHLVDFETTVSTAADQQVVTAGKLEKKWSSGGRNYFHYRAEQPIAFMFALSSARYEVREERYRGIAFRVFHHPGHTANVPAMLQAMKDAIDYGNTHFSPYPFDHLSLAEIPHYPGAATAYPGVLFGAERISFLTDFADSSRFNVVYATTAHEVGHQWWANALMPLAVPGAPCLTESLAKYTEAVTVEQRFGKMYLRRYLQSDSRIYFSTRNLSGVSELPLNRAVDQPYVYYQKGGLALYAIRETLGAERMARALRRLIGRHGYPHPKAAVASLTDELCKEATPAEKAYIREWFEKVIVYDNRLKLLSCEALPRGRYRVRVQVTIQKTDQSEGGLQQLVPDGVIALAAFDKEEKAWDRHTQPFYLQKHAFSEKEMMVTLELDRKPRILALDPYICFLDKNMDDNTVVLP